MAQYWTNDTAVLFKPKAASIIHELKPSDPQVKNLYLKTLTLTEPDYTASTA